MAHKELDLMTRKKVTLQLARRYRKASKKEKSRILDEFCTLTGYNRNYASFLLRNAGKTVTIRTSNGLRVRVIADPHRKIRRNRKPIYDEEVRKALAFIWAVLDFPASRLLAAALPWIVPKLEALGALNLSPTVRQKLLQISPATIDRLLAPLRTRLAPKSRSRTKRGPLLKHQIPIRTHRDWQDLSPGFLEIDLVGHDGGNTRGDYAFTLVATDVYTQWVELVPLRNRARIWAVQALDEIARRLPFPIQGLDCDNDSAFINHHLIAWCKERDVVFTRSRPYWKNDNCHVEQKNGHVVRRFVGHFRYDTEDALRVLGEVERLVSLYVNFFKPTMKLVKKVWKGSRVKRVYDRPKTPYQRVMEDPTIPEEVKEKLRKTFQELNPLELRKRILELQKTLFSLARPLEVDHEDV